MRKKISISSTCWMTWFVYREADLEDKNPFCVKFDVYCDLKTKLMQEIMFPYTPGKG